MFLLHMRKGVIKQNHSILWKIVKSLFLDFIVIFLIYSERYFHSYITNNNDIHLFGNKCYNCMPSIKHCFIRWIILWLWPIYAIFTAARKNWEVLKFIKPTFHIWNIFFQKDSRLTCHKRFSKIQSCGISVYASHKEGVTKSLIIWLKNKIN